MPRPTARFRRRTRDTVELERAPAVPRHEQPRAVVLGLPPRLPATPVVRRPLAEERPGARVGAVGPSRPHRPGRLRCTSPGRGAPPPSVGSLEKTRDAVGLPHDRHDELALRERAEVRLGELGQKLLAQVAQVELEENDARDAEGSPLRSRRALVAPPHDGEGQRQRRVEKGARADEEAAPAVLSCLAASASAAGAPASTGPRGTRCRPRHRPRVGPRPSVPARRAAPARRVPRARSSARPRGAREGGALVPRHAIVPQGPRGARRGGRARLRPAGPAPCAGTRRGPGRSRGRTPRRSATSRARAGPGDARPRPGRSRRSSGTAGPRARRAAR